MSLRATCPSCGCQGDIAAFLVEDDAKRVIAKLAVVDARLGRAVVDYLPLFKPAKTALRLPRVLRLVDELLALVATGTVCKDERSSARRKATPAAWIAGIEHLLAQRERLSLPLVNHHYLRAVVFGLAEQLNAQAEQQVETDRRAGKHRSAEPVSDPLHEATLYADRMVQLGGWDSAKRTAYLAEQRAKQAGGA